MIKTEADLDRILDHQLVIAPRRFGPVPAVIRRAIRERRLVRVLPGIYARAATARDTLVRMAAIQLRDPDAVFVGLSAAGLLWDPRLLPSQITVTGRLRRGLKGIRFARRAIDPEWILTRNGLRCTVPALTAIDLIPGHGGEYVDRYLRSAGSRGPAALDLMWRALAAHPHRRGNAKRRRILIESRDQPWSAAERKAHIDLRAASIGGWSANYQVTAEGNRYFIDIAFPHLKLAIEIDGVEYHTGRAAVERDLARQNDLVCAGWTVLRFTWAMLQDPGWVDRLQRWLRPRKRRVAAP